MKLFILLANKSLEVIYSLLSGDICHWCDCILSTRLYYNLFGMLTKLYQTLVAFGLTQST